MDRVRYSFWGASGNEDEARRLGTRRRDARATRVAAEEVASGSTSLNWVVLKISYSSSWGPPKIV
jgi:hypothetical protein